METFERVVSDHYVNVPENQSVFGMMNACIYERTRKLFLITGGTQSGKSHFCNELFRSIKTQRKPYVGISKVTPMFFTGKTLALALEEDVEKSREEERGISGMRMNFTDLLGIDAKQKQEGVVLIVDDIDTFPFSRRELYLRLRKLVCFYSVVATSKGSEGLPSEIFGEFTMHDLKEISAESLELIIYDFVEEYGIKRVTSLMVEALVFLYKNKELGIGDIKDVLMDWKSCVDTDAMPRIKQRLFYRYFWKYALQQQILRFMSDAPIEV